MLPPGYPRKPSLKTYLGCNWEKTPCYSGGTLPHRRRVRIATFHHCRWEHRKRLHLAVEYLSPEFMG